MLVALELEFCRMMKETKSGTWEDNYSICRQQIANSQGNRVKISNSPAFMLIGLNLQKIFDIIFPN